MGSVKESHASVMRINSAEAAKNSSHKRKMKKLFTKAGVKTPKWYVYKNDIIHEVRKSLHGLIYVKTDESVIKYPVVVKGHFGLKNKNNKMCNNEEELKQVVTGLNENTFIVEQYYNYAREYRLHVSKNGCFWSYRKMLKSDAKDRWYRNSKNCVFVTPENDAFNEPSNWEDIEWDCVRALNAVGLDIGAFDVRVQTKEPNNWMIIEVNSGPSVKGKSVSKYRREIVNLILQKQEEDEEAKYTT